MQYKNGSPEQGNEDDLSIDAVRGDGTYLKRSEVKTEAKIGSLDTGGVEGGVRSEENDAVNLQRRVGLVSGVALIVGTMIGSGIFVSPKGVLQRSGSPGLSLVVWAGCGFLSLFGALAYAELGTIITESGGEHSFYMEAFNPKAKRHLKSWYRPIPAFLLAWTTIMIIKSSSLAIITLTSAEYIVRLARLGCDHSRDTNWQDQKTLGVKLIAASIIVLITIINSVSVKLATKIQNIFTAAKLLAIIIIVVGGIYKLATGNTQYLDEGFQGSNLNFGDIATAFYSGLWAYDGWNNLNYVTEELKNPYRDLPRAIMIALPLVTICYVLINISYLAVMSTEELLASETVAVTFGNRVLGAAAFLMPLAVTFSTFGAANGTAFTSGRLCFVAAREGHMVDVLSYVDSKKLTPSPALLFNGLVALLMVLPSDIGSLIDFFSFTAWIFYGGAMVALIVLRFTKPDVPRPYKVPIIIPVIVLIISIYLVIAPIVEAPQIEYLYATCFILVGLVFYFPFVYLKKSIPGMGHFTTFCQLLLEVVPTNKIPDP